MNYSQSGRSELGIWRIVLGEGIHALESSLGDGTVRTWQYQSKEEEDFGGVMEGLDTEELIDLKWCSPEWSTEELGP